jgi:ketosteroid isomerase-like protein
MSELQLHPKAAESLSLWHAMIRTGDLQALPALLDPDAVFRSPMAHTPYPGAPVVSMILNTVFNVFEDTTANWRAPTA